METGIENLCGNFEMFSPELHHFQKQMPAGNYNQIALNRLQKLKEEGVKLCLRMVDNIYCEACQKLKDIVEDTQRCC